MWEWWEFGGTVGICGNYMKLWEWWEWWELEIKAGLIQKNNTLKKRFKKKYNFSQ